MWKYQKILENNYLPGKKQSRDDLKKSKQLIIKTNELFTT